VQIPGYLEELDNLKALGVDEVIITAVNDAAVMRAWATDQKCDDVDGQLTLMGDPRGELVKAFGIELTHPGPIGKGLVNRGKRTAIYIEAGVIKVIRIAEAPDDPAGDDHPDVTLAGAMKEAIMESKHAEL
jgi:peroxiredoxin